MRPLAQNKNGLCSWHVMYTTSHHHAHQLPASPLIQPSTDLHRIQKHMWPLVKPPSGTDRGHTWIACQTLSTNYGNTCVPSLHIVHRKSLGLLHIHTSKHVCLPMGTQCEPTVTSYCIVHRRHW